MNQAELSSHLPDRIRGLGKLAYNLWWSWHPRARELFRRLDLPAWRESEHNPILMLNSLHSSLLAGVTEDRAFLQRYDEAMAQFETDTASHLGWFAETYGRLLSPLAYFSAEYGLHASLPFYAGGLGILAGDHLKQCSDLSIPAVAVGLIYTEGYVSQRIGEDGWQQDVEKTLDRTFDPITQVLNQDGEPLMVQVPLLDPPVYVTVWRADIGRVALYLLDTDLEANQAWDRAIDQHLYASNPEQRLRQEIVLGMGGMRVLQAMDIRPAALHLNEGHPALAILERIRALVEEGASFDAAVEQVRRSTIFTTHTPLPAGTDVYSFQLMEKYFDPYYAELGTDHNACHQLGVNPLEPSAGFNMTVFALRMARFRNGVSQRHGRVARTMWSALWPDRPQEDVPIGAITNGIHLPTWIEPTRLQPLLDTYLGSDWTGNQGRPETWARVDEIPDADLWHLHRDLKVMLIGRITELDRRRWQEEGMGAGSVVAFGALLDPEALTIGFARRFTDYKRPDLLFYDLERIGRLLTDPWHPVQIIFAGKAHPSDVGGKRLIQNIFRLAEDRQFAGRIAFIENYDQSLAQYLVHGVDIWLNNPLPPLEASGTSGIKASVNGVPHLSIMDGWWLEGYNGSNGWAFGGEAMQSDRTQADAEALYRLLEDEIIPLYCERSDDQIPHDFVRVMKEAIKSVAPAFSAQRMVKEYVSQYYVPALGLGGT